MSWRGSVLVKQLQIEFSAIRTIRIVFKILAFCCIYTEIHVLPEQVGGVVGVHSFYQCLTNSLCRERGRGSGKIDHPRIEIMSDSIASLVAPIIAKPKAKRGRKPKVRPSGIQIVVSGPTTVYFD